MPLKRVGWGLVLALLDLTIQGFDLLPDVLGWALVASGLGRLVPLPAARGPVLLARCGAWVAAAIAAPIWLLTPVQRASAPLTEVEFVAGIPAPLTAVQFVLDGVVLVLVAGALVAVAGAAGAEADRRVWNTLRLWLAVSLAVTSVLTAGAVVTRIEPTAAASVVVAIVNLLVTVCATWTTFRHADRSWAAAGRPPAASSTGSVRGTVPPLDRAEERGS